MMYDLVLNGEVLWSKDFEGAPDNLAMVSHKGLWLPRVLVGLDTWEAYDPDTQVQLPPEIVVGLTEVTYTYELRALALEDLLPFKRISRQTLETEFRRRNDLPIEVEVDGVMRTWHGDFYGMKGIDDVLLGILFGVTANPRLWKPYQCGTIEVSHDGFKAIKVAHGLREESLFAIWQGLQAVLDALTTSSAVQAFNPLDGWEE